MSDETELFAKESEDADVSGWGYELTLRSPAAGEPQAWALELLFASIGGEESPLSAVAFTADRVVQAQRFPFGRFAFLQLVGVTPAELEEMKASLNRGRLPEHADVLRVRIRSVEMLRTRRPGILRRWAIVSRSKASCRAR